MSFLSSFTVTFSNYRFAPYAWVLSAVSLLSLGIGLLICLKSGCRKGGVPGARYLAALELCVFQWSFAYIFEAAATTVALKHLWSQIAYLGTAGTSLFFFYFTMVYSQQDRINSAPSRIAVSLVPVLTVLLAATNGLHRWVWTGITIDPASNIAVYQHGFWFWIFVVYSYCLVLAGMAFLTNAVLRFHGFYSTQTLILLFGALLPFIANIVYVFDLDPIPGLDWTPVFFMFSGLVLALGMTRFRFLDLVPVARDKLMDNLQDGVLVIDVQGRVVDLNRRLEQLLDTGEAPVIGRPARQVLSRWVELRDLLVEGASLPAAAVIIDEDRQSAYEACVFPLAGPRGTPAGRMLTVRDVSGRHRAESEREKLVVELRAALAKVKKLSGLLPICSHCKKIRDDQGYWHTVETYVSTHTDADFTHSLCPSCLRELYPQYHRRSPQDAGPSPGRT